MQELKHASSKENIDDCPFSALGQLRDALWDVSPCRDSAFKYSQEFISASSIHIFQAVFPCVNVPLKMVQQSRVRKDWKTSARDGMGNHRNFLAHAKMHFEMPRHPNISPTTSLIQEVRVLAQQPHSDERENVKLSFIVCDGNR